MAYQPRMQGRGGDALTKVNKEIVSLLMNTLLCKYSLSFVKSSKKLATNFSLQFLEVVIMTASVSHA